jgi:hypothetical protein
VRVAPRAEEGRDVLRQPQEEPDEHERQRERHAVAVPADGEVRRRTPGHGDEQPGERPAKVRQPVVGDEVGVDGAGDRRGRHGPVARDPQVEQPPRRHDVAADRRVEEAAVERHAEHLRDRRLGVRPRAERYLDQLEHQSDQVETGDDQHLPARLPADEPEQRRDQDAVDQQGVVTRDRQRHDLGHREPAEHRDREGAAAGLRPREAQQLRDEEPHVRWTCLPGAGCSADRGQLSA